MKKRITPYGILSFILMLGAGCLTVGSIAIAQSAPEADKAVHSSPDQPDSRKQQDQSASKKTHLQRTGSADENAALKDQLAKQQTQINQLLQVVEQLKQRLDAVSQPASRTTEQASSPMGGVGQVASLSPVLPSAVKSSETTAAYASMPAAGAAPVTQDQMQAYVQKVDQLNKTVGAFGKGLDGFKFSGDLRFRTDGIFRSGNSVAGPQQNIRERYRVRFNVDKAINDQFGFHMQLGTGTANNPTTFDSDFMGNNTRGHIFLSEYYADYHPTKEVSFRAGKMEEVFADNAKFVFDDDVRFNGFHEIARIPISDNASVEFRAGQYIFTNPNIQILPSAAACSGSNPPAQCIFVNAGYQPGGKVRDSYLFHQGVVFNVKTGSNWKHKFVVDYQHYRNPNQLLIGSSASGAAILVNGYVGQTLSGGVGQSGNGTTTPGGFIYTSPDYHVGHIDYEVSYAGWKTSRQSWPVFLDLQGAHNFGADFLANAEMATVGIGSVKKMGDLRFLYGYFVKDANAMISQVTDDDIGSGVGTNIRTHYIRVDLGLTKFLQWQNLLFIQNEISPNDPARDFYTPLQKGANTLYRIQSQLQFTF